ncbi:hypothetical protein B0H11DRAFT_1916041 [Mycena galericulata]|nr:hypothetical protein B0H11DRAFT_1916041 [Mycena galericulata]
MDGVYLTLIEDHPELKDLAKDPHFVQMACSHYIKDWQMGALTGVDYWSRAEEFIAKRRSGKIDPLQYLIEVDEKFEALLFWSEQQDKIPSRHNAKKDDGFVYQECVQFTIGLLWKGHRKSSNI